MRTDMNFTPGHGASPSTRFQFDLDPWTASDMLATAERIRLLTRAFADEVAQELTRHELWADGETPAKLARALDVLIDEHMHQDKLEEAGEIA